MVVKLSRSPRFVRVRLWQWIPPLLITIIASGSFAAVAAAQDDPEAASKKLFAEAKKAATIEDQNRVLQDIEKLRESNVSESVSKYLISLEAWLLHQRGETHAKLAEEANRRGDTTLGRDLDTKAMEDFDAAIGLDPKRWKSYHHRGVCFALMGKFEQAVKDFSKTVELRPKYASAWFNRAEIYYELGEFAKAVSDYSRAIALQPKDAGFYTGRGHAYFQLRRFKQAFADYDRAVSLAGEKNSEYFANRGDAYRSLGQWEKAASDFRKAIMIDKSYGRAFQSAAWLMATCPDPQFRNAGLAIRSAERAIKLDGDSDYIYLDTLAAALANAGEFDRAEATLRRAISAAPAENVAPLRDRLKLYRTRRPFRQTVSVTPAPERTAKRPK